MNNKIMTEHHHEQHDRTMLGFWIYLMTDLLMFAILFAAYAVLRNNTAGSVTIKEIFDPPYVLAETIILLVSSFTVGLATLAVQNNKKGQSLFWFALTFTLGAAFLVMELNEFKHLVADGHSWRSSAFLSSFFALVGTHGLHIAAGLLWMAIAMIQILKRGLTHSVNSKLIRLGLFWHFLDIVWIFIFTFVYLMSLT